LILFDGYKPHLDINFLDLAKENGVVMSFPSHTFLKVQPSDKSFYGPSKKFVKSAPEARIRSNPGKTMTIYDIPFIASRSLRNALTPKTAK
jgi:hypothetical protein